MDSKNKRITELTTFLKMSADDFFVQLEDECYKSMRGGGCILVGDPTKEMELTTLSKFELKNEPIFIGKWHIKPATNIKKHHTVILTISLSYPNPGDVIQFCDRPPIVLDPDTDSNYPCHLTEPVIWFEVLQLTEKIRLTGKYENLVVNSQPVVANLFNQFWNKFTESDQISGNKITNTNPPDYKRLLKKFREHLSVLQVREAKYAGNAPLELLNQIKDYQQAIYLTEKILKNIITTDEWREELNLLAISFEP